MKSRALATRYARALAATISGLDEIERTAGELSTLAAVMRANPKISALFENPAISAETRRRIAGDITQSAALSPRTGRFVDLLIEHDRLGLLEECAVVFQEIRDEKLGFVAAEITTATPLDAALEQAWMRKLTEMTGKKVRLTKKVNPAIIGGAVARIGSKVYDGSLKSRLAGLRAQLIQT